MIGPGKTTIDLIQVEVDGEFGIAINGVLGEERFGDKRTGEEGLHFARARARVREQAEEGVLELVRGTVEPWLGDIGPNKPTDGRWVADTIRVELERYTADPHNNLLREAVFGVIRAHGGFALPGEEEEARPRVESAPPGEEEARTPDDDVPF